MHILLDKFLLKLYFYCNNNIFNEILNAIPSLLQCLAYINVLDGILNHENKS